MTRGRTSASVPSLGSTASTLSGPMAPKNNSRVWTLTDSSLCRKAPANEPPRPSPQSLDERTTREGREEQERSNIGQGRLALVARCERIDCGHCRSPRDLQFSRKFGSGASPGKHHGLRSGHCCCD